MRLPQLGVGEKFVNPRRNQAWVLVCRRAVLRVVFRHAIFLALLISFDCSAETPALAKAQVVIEQINLHNVERAGTPIPPRLEQICSHGSGDGVVFVTPVSDNGNPVSNKQAKEKGCAIEEKGVNWVGEQLESYFQLLLPMFIWFVMGVIIGGGFLYRRR